MSRPKPTVEDIVIYHMYDSVAKTFTSRSIMQAFRWDRRGRVSTFKKSTVQTALRNLTKKGFLERTRSHDDGGIGNEYVYKLTKSGETYGWAGKPERPKYTFRQIAASDTKIGQAFICPMGRSLIRCGNEIWPMFAHGYRDHVLGYDPETHKVYGIHPTNTVTIAPL